ncbi:Uncharacterised protein [Streptococcus pneumoniae]|nr:Uncharacterised protein [Streptococcus pneumoniae]
MEVLNLFSQFQTFHRLKHPHNVTTLSYHYFENSVSLLTYNLYTSIGFFSNLSRFLLPFSLQQLEKMDLHLKMLHQLMDYLQSLSQFLLLSFPFHCKYSTISDYGNQRNDADSPQKTRLSAILLHLLHYHE